jgi:subtilisin family serine protease
MMYMGLRIVVFLLAAMTIFPQYRLSSQNFKKFDLAGSKSLGVIKTADETAQKVSPVVNYVLSNIRNEKGIVNKASVQKLMKENSFAVLTKDENNQVYMPVFIKTVNVSASSASITAAGGKVQTVAGDIITAEVPVEYVTDIAGSKDVLFVDAAAAGKPLLNESGKDIAVEKVHNGVSLPGAYKGNGVVVGVLDTGIDWQHEDFQAAGGNRIRYLWDMSSNSNPPSGYNYGTEYDKASLDAKNCNEKDGDDGGGHGTHVTGIAAGNGSALEDYTGMAPEADIIFVKGFRNTASFANSDVVNGCNYIFSKAAQLGKPAVINLSLGGHVGAHDGTSLYEQALSNLTGPGKIIVAAAGNEGGVPVHLGYTTSGTKIEELSQTYWIIPPGTDASAVDMWYDTGNISVGIAAYDHSLNLLGYTNPVAPGQKIENTNFEINGTNYGVVSIDATTTSDPNNGAGRVFFVIDSDNGQIDLNAVYWVLYTFGSGTFDAWQVADGYFTTDSDPAKKIMPGDFNKTVGSPGTSEKLICVGSYVTKNQWVDIDGQTRIQGGNPVIGSISTFSSIGPSRDGRIKPDLAAPGEAILSAFSRDLTISNDFTPRSSILSGGKLQKMQGTSMAAPHVTGVVALMLQAKPDLDYAGALAILKATARKDNFTGESTNNVFGAGKLDAYNAVKSASGTGSGNMITIIDENFDSSTFPGGWTVVSTNTLKTWALGNPQDKNFNTIVPSSINSAICPWVDEDQNEWLLSSPFSLGQGEASVEFYAGYSTRWLDAATLHLNITEDGTNWTRLWTAENDNQEWSWRKKTVDLSAYAGKSNLKIAWQYAGRDGDLVGVDGIKLLGYSPSTDVDDKGNLIPAEYSIEQNYPNPFNPSTTIEFTIAAAGNVSLKVYDLLGSEVSTLVNEVKTPGVYKYNFDASGLASGLYFYVFKAGSFIQTRKMILLK